MKISRKLKKFLTEVKRQLREEDTDISINKDEKTLTVELRFFDSSDEEQTTTLVAEWFDTWELDVEMLIYCGYNADMTKRYTSSDVVITKNQYEACEAMSVIMEVVRVQAIKDYIFYD